MVCLQMLPNFLGKRKLFSEKKGIRLKFTRKVHIYFIDNKYFHRAKQYLKKNVFFFKKKHLSNLNLIIFAHCSLLHNFNFSIMNKTELINAMAEKSGMPKTQVKKALDAMVSATAETLKKGDRIQLFGLGTFSVSERSARTCRNPQNNKTVKVPAKKVVKFKACAQLKEL